MSNMPPNPATGNAAGVATRHLWVYCDAAGTAWGYGDSPESARASADRAFYPLGGAVEVDDASSPTGFEAELDAEYRGGFTLELLVPVTVKPVALRTILRALTVIA